MSIQKILVFLFSCVATTNVTAWIMAPSDQYSCVSKYAGGVTDQYIANLVTSGCIEYFSAKTNKERRLWECVIENASKSKNQTAANFAFHGCADKYPTK